MGDAALPAPAACPGPVRLHCTLRATGDQGALSGDDSFTAQASPEVGHHREARAAGDVPRLSVPFAWAAVVPVSNAASLTTAPLRRRPGGANP